MKTLEEINQAYQHLCIQLGDVEVKLKGLENKKAALFAQIEKLDEEAAKVMTKETE